MFAPVPSSPNFPELEGQILAFWRENDIASKAVSKPAPGGDYVFYEGPPTANGLPGIHHVISRAMKDLFPRFHTMQGKRVWRRSGWDTHGLPVEIGIEKEIGSTSKADIERFGVAEFNQKCRDSVFRYIQEWTTLTERIGFWLDHNDGYITYTNDYIESCWWILKNLHERGLLFEDYKVAMHCPRCNTSLASHEVSQGMAENVEDPSIWVIFDVDQPGVLSNAEGDEPLGLVIWTTTPWTLAANSGIAVNPHASYVVVRHNRRRLVIAEQRLEAVFGDETVEVLGHFSGQELSGITYRQLLVAENQESVDTDGSWRVVADSFVSLDDGTGLVHLAPAYGDLDQGRTHGLATLFSVGLDGRVLPGVQLAVADPTEGERRNRELTGERAEGSSLTAQSATLGNSRLLPLDVVGMFFKDADAPIMDALEARGALLRRETVRHAYPLCWRDDTPLLFFAKNSWYIRTTAVKDQLLTNNAAINWVPSHIKNGRFGKWLENNVDWAISRERYWGTPLPIWQSEDGEVLAIGSAAELSELTGQDMSNMDLHRPYVDNIEIQKDGKTFRRVPHTIDVWFDSGAMPLAQWGYPYRRAEEFSTHFPADFICEAIDQTRGWFYSLHAIATLLTDAGTADRPAGPLFEQFGSSPAFRNCVVIGFINDAHGRKMSKSRGNTVDPWEVINSRGADPLRWYLYAANPPEANKNFDIERLDEATRGFLMTLWNCYSFFVTYANLDKPLLQDVPLSERPNMDRWLEARLEEVTAEVTTSLHAYDPYTACAALTRFVVDDFSNWYLRLSRRRFWKTESSTDKEAAYRTAFEVLTTIAHLSAPLTPFVAEYMWRNLRTGMSGEAAESIHLSDWPQQRPDRMDAALVNDMRVTAKAVELARAARAAAKLRTRVPVSAVLIRASETDRAAITRQTDLLLAEVNAKSLEFLDGDTTLVEQVVRPNFRVLGPRLGKNLAVVQNAVKAADAAEIVAAVADGGSWTVPDHEITLSAEDLLIETRPAEGISATEGEGLVVALRTELNDELIAEGWARDLVRLVQQARKDGGLDVSDRIEFALTGPEHLLAALEPHQEMVAREVLATHFESGVTMGDAVVDYATPGEIDGTLVTIQLRRA